MSEERKERRDRCYFWGRQEWLEVQHEETCGHPDDYEGYCHRSPPVFLDTRLRLHTKATGGDEGAYHDIHSFWSLPVVCGAFWCGEFKEKQP